MAHLLKELQEKKAMLKSVDTVVTTQLGQQYTEKTIGESGIIERTPLCSSSSSPGFVIDQTPDMVPGFVFDNLLIGSQDLASSRDVMTDLGITHILNVGAGIPCWFPEDFVYKSVNLLDIPEENRLTECLPETNNFIENSRQHGKVLVHCNAGISRSSAIIIGYLMSLGMTYSAAYEMVKLCRPQIKPNAGFVSQLKRLKYHVQ